MLNKFTCIVLALLAPHFFCALAQDRTIKLEEFHELMLKKGRIECLNCDFMEAKSVKGLKGLVRGNGRFSYSSSGKMIMDYVLPQGNRIIMDSTGFQIIVNGKAMVSKANSNPMMAQFSNLMMACMSGQLDSFSHSWDLEITENGDDFDVSITPSDRRIGKYIKCISMFFSGDDFTLNSMKISNNDEVFTEYKFSNKEIVYE